MKQIMSDCVIDTVRSAEDLGKKQYQEFVAECISGNTTTFSNNIHKNNLPPVESKFINETCKICLQISNLWNDVNLFSLVVKTQMFKTKTKTLSYRTKTHKSENQNHNSITDWLKKKSLLTY